MVEVFKTNVKDMDEANLLLSLIHRNFKEFQANFDLDDCDKILRVKSISTEIQASCLIDLLKDLGVVAEVLPDDQFVKPQAAPRYMCCIHRSRFKE